MFSYNITPIALVCIVGYFLYFYAGRYVLQGWWKRGDMGGGVGVGPPDFGRIESAARHRRRAAFLLAHPDFQTLRHLRRCVFYTFRDHLYNT